MISEAVFAALINACRADEQQWDAFAAACDAAAPAQPQWEGRTLSRTEAYQLRSRLEARAIKAQALKIALCVGRRVDAVASVPLQPKLRHAGDGATRRLSIELIEGKIDRVAEWVPCPPLFADIVLEAITKAQAYTAVLRTRAAASFRDHLFLLDGRGHGSGVVLKGTALQSYLFADYPRRDLGLVQRYEIRDNGALVYIRTHDFRTTRLTRIVEGGGSVFLAAQDAGHRVRDENPVLTATFYIAGTDVIIREIEERLAARAISGRYLDQLLDAERTRSVIDDPLPEELVQLRRAGSPVAMTKTRYGTCLLQAESGPCPTSHACYLGIFPESAAVQLGRGCPWQALTPEALTALRRDEADLVLQIEAFRAEPGYRTFTRQAENTLRIVRAQIAQAERLLASLVTFRARAQAAGELVSDADARRADLSA